MARTFHGSLGGLPLLIHTHMSHTTYQPKWLCVMAPIYDRPGTTYPATRSDVRTTRTGGPPGWSKQQTRRLKLGRWVLTLDVDS